MIQRYNDAMAIVLETGFPDFFVTFTCNPEWPEIVECIESYQETCYRPDIESRVFKLKLDELINDITEKQLFGVPIAFVYVIEFQKRGHPHAHILLTLRTEDKPKTAEIIDQFISAQIPDPNTDPVLYELVKKNMIHGPCISTSACMQKKNKCSKGYPKEFCQETRLVANQFPLYCRPFNGRIVTKKCRGENNQFVDMDFDNRWVVPYNRYLLLKYRAHINVEICGTLHAVKYLYKYIYKGIFI